MRTRIWHTRTWSLLLALLAVAALPVLALTPTASTVPGAADHLAQPIPVTPGVPIFAVTAVATLPAGGCYVPLPLEVGGPVIIRGGVNIRSGPSLAEALVNYTSEETLAAVTEGPVCANGFNWWRVNMPAGNDGWVAEGRPDAEYFVVVPPSVLEENACAPAQPFVQGERLVVLSSVRLRQNAGTAGLVLTVVPAGELVTVLSGPMCVDGLNWWLVDATVVNFPYRGWIAESAAGSQYVQSLSAVNAEVCAAPLPFDLGTAGYVDLPPGQEPRYLRSTPGRDAPVLLALIHGTPFTIIGGPVCADGTNWWQVQLRSNLFVIGWLSEGGPPQYVISRISAGDRPN